MAQHPRSHADLSCRAEYPNSFKPQCDARDFCGSPESGRRMNPIGVGLVVQLVVAGRLK